MEEMKRLNKEAVDAEYITDYASLCQPRFWNEGALFDMNDTWIGQFNVSRDDSRHLRT